MHATPRRWPSMSAALVGVIILYSYGLNSPTAYLSIEEVQHARQAFSLATTGESIMGQRWPLYFAQPDFLPGRDPIWVYVGALMLRVAPFSEGLVRTPSVIAGLASVVVMFFVAQRVFERRWLALVAAVLLAFSPVHFIHSRIATSQIGLVLVVLAWLLFLLRYLDMRNRRDLVLAAICLGAGMYVYLPATLMMPLYFGVTLMLVARSTPDARWRTDVSIACVAFAAMLVPWLAWHFVHPERFQQLADYYSANGYNRSETSIFTLRGILNRADYWWNTYNPGLLFLSGDSNIRFSTRNVGCFLVPLAVLIAIALTTALGGMRRDVRWLAFAGLLIGPLPAVAAGDFEVKRWLTVVPFVILAATAGVASMARWPRLWFATTAGGLMVVAGAQFVPFLIDYHGDYRVRSIPWFGGNMRGAVLEVARSVDHAGCVFLDARLYPDYWPLYAGVSGRADLARQTNLVDLARDDFRAPPDCHNTYLIVSEELIRENHTARARVASPAWVSQGIPEPGGQSYLLVMRHAANH